MPVDYAIDPKLGVVFRWWRGLVTPLEIVDNAERLRSDPLFDERFSDLVESRARLILFPRARYTQLWLREKSRLASPGCTRRHGKAPIAQFSATGKMPAPGSE
jgi:hypothetical protein